MLIFTLFFVFCVDMIELLKKKASEAGKNVSRFILDMVIQNPAEKHDDLDFIDLPL